MSTNELLYPRYKVIAIWPGMHAEPFHLEQVITLQPYEDEDYKGFIHIPIKHIPGSFMREGFFSGHPHLFKKLHWSEEREPGQMPEYIKSINGWIHKVKERKEGGCNTEDNWWIPYSNSTPATLAEYEAYINQKEK